MGESDIDNFFDPYGDDEGEEWKPGNIYGKELFSKSVEIYNLIETYCAVLPQDNDGHSEYIQQLMKENILLIPLAIRAAVKNDVYSKKMEGAVIIKAEICKLRDQVLESETVHEMERKYPDMLRNEIDNFREIFVTWVNTFDKNNDLPDEWHLFNDPSTFPEKDKPFDIQSFLDGLNGDDEK